MHYSVYNENEYTHIYDATHNYANYDDVGKDLLGQDNISNYDIIIKRYNNIIKGEDNTVYDNLSIIKNQEISEESDNANINKNINKTVINDTKNNTINTNNKIINTYNTINTKTNNKINANNIKKNFNYTINLIKSKILYLLAFIIFIIILYLFIKNFLINTIK